LPSQLNHQSLADANYWPGSVERWLGRLLLSYNDNPHLPWKILPCPAPNKSKRYARL
jgi:hypothetical protein